MNQIPFGVLRNTVTMDLSCTFFRINDNEGAAEMLIDTLGANIVNATDSKGR